MYMYYLLGVSYAEQLVPTSMVSFQQTILYVCGTQTLVITMPADGLAPYGARPSAGLALTWISDMFLQTFSGYHDF